jgi:hypothetical protein
MSSLELGLSGRALIIKGLFAVTPLLDLGTNPGTGLRSASKPVDGRRKDTCLDRAKTSERRAPAARKTKKSVFLVSRSRSIEANGTKGCRERPRRTIPKSHEGRGTGLAGLFLAKKRKREEMAFSTPCERGPMAVSTDQMEALYPLRVE